MARLALALAFGLVGFVGCDSKKPEVKKEEVKKDTPASPAK